MDITNNSKATRKVLKKQKKCRHMLEKEQGVTCSETATRFIAICNAGLVNALSEEVIYENFIKYGPIENILMLPGKSYCFVTFREVKHSVTAFENTNGKLNIGQYNKPIYLQYIITLPQVLNVNNDVRPAGLMTLDDFISPEEENILLALNDFDTSETSTLKHRQVRHYGYEFCYGNNDVDKSQPMSEVIPEECNFLWERLRLKLPDVPFHGFKPDQLTVNHYKPGHGIPPHVDTHSAFEDPIVSLSLGSSVVMDFKNRDLHCTVFLPRRSLLIMSGESRYDWTHGITPRKLDVVPSGKSLFVSHRGTRTSYTFRKIREGRCNCKYVDKCDSFAAEVSRSKTIANNVAVKLERMHVHEVYEQIASHFSITRHKPWPNVLKFLRLLPVGSLLVDVGCGNGKYLGCNRNVYSVGCDCSFNLIEDCNEKGFQAFTCNCLNLPIRDCIADGVISIAVIHHLANEGRRLQAIREIVRVLRVRGRALIYVWARDQNRDQEKTSYLKQDRKNRKGECEAVSETQFETVVDDVSLPVHTNRRQFQYQDLLVPWKLRDEANSNGDNLFLRFYHVFEDGELEKLCLSVENVRIVQSYYDQGNWCCMLEKIK